MELVDFVAAVRERLRQTGHTKHSAAVAHGLPKDAIQRVLAGKVPKLDRAVAICEALGLEFYVGPKRAAIADPDVYAFSLTLQGMESTIAVLDDHHVDDAAVVDLFVQTYVLYVDLIDRIAATGRTREEAAGLLRKTDRLGSRSWEPRSIGLDRRRPREPDNAPSNEEAARIVHEAMRELSAKPTDESALPPQDRSEEP